MDDRLGQSIWVLRFQTLLLAVFSIFSVLLAVVGVYSVMSYFVSQRTTEIGIRLAVGADPFKTLQQIVSEGAPTGGDCRVPWHVGRHLCCAGLAERRRCRT